MSVPQQVFLRDAMRRMNMTRETFASRIGVSRRALDTWLLPDDSQESRAMPEIVERFVSEIVVHGEPGENYTQSVDSQSLASQMLFEGKPQLLSVDQFSRDSVEALFRVADIMQPIARRRKISRVLEGAVLGNLFFEASTRTRVSFGAAFCRLGGSVCDTTGFTFSSMAKGESIYDTSRVMSGYVDALVIRHPEQGSVAEFARATNVPVINGGDGPGEHPSQALLDLYTIQREFSRLGKIVDGEMLSYIIEQISRNDHVIEQTHDLPAGLRGADVVYATRIQKERFTDESFEGYTPDFQINQALMDSACGADTLIMHPLPRDSRPGANDLSVDLNHDSRLAIFRQTDNGIPVRMAIFAVLLGVEKLVQHSMRDAAWRPPVYLGPDDAVFHGID